MQFAELSPQLSVESKGSQGALYHKEAAQCFSASDPHSRAANLLASRKKAAILILSLFLLSH